MTRKQLVKLVADLANGEGVCLSIDADLEVCGRMCWLEEYSASLIDLHLADTDVSEFEPTKKMVVDCTAIVKFNDRIKRACAESDRQAKKSNLDKLLYLDGIYREAERLNIKLRRG